jgi:predicted aspartyl protease
MGIFRTTLGVENQLRPGVVESLSDVLVDTGAELSWVPTPVLERLGVARKKRVRFQMADGGVIERSVGFAVLHAGGEFTVDEVIFGEPGDLVILGARTLEGLNLRVDLQAKRLVSAGPILAAAGA